MSGTRTLEGLVLAGPDFEPIEGRVVVEDGEIAAIEEASVASDDWILPAFVNAHTHIGDSIAKEAGRGLSLDELVAPPDGLKHRLLRETPRDEMVAAMRESVAYMREGGTASFVEFREGGAEGVDRLREAAADSPVEPVILGREEVAAMEAGDGFGASGARDGEFGTERNATREAGKLFGVHAGERDSHDVDGALDLDPDFLVHMVHVEDYQLERVADRGTPVVCCPRSNLVTNVGLPDFDRLNDATTLALGTDNVMLNSPSVFRETEFAAKHSDLDAPTVLRMATRNGARIAGKEYGLVEEGRPAKLQVLDGGNHNLGGARDPVRAVVRRAGVADVREVLL
ncbi:amidohydrolase family protein [Halosegnis marinus]|uniref:Amidohydrolase family protein n=1 Tax=Halosegnis marinus TaxID=3034023 RepID=A0ABD5ZKC2_9EURY|nr:amidohydrolase family protein [Halosegnis sp. DT85]